MEDEIQLPKAKPGDLEPLLSRHSSGGGDSWYVLLCKHCTDSHKITTKRIGRQSKDPLTVAARKFRQAGWRMDGGIPVCPGCYKNKINNDLYPAD